MKIRLLAIVLALELVLASTLAVSQTSTQISASGPPPTAISVSTSVPVISVGQTTVYSATLLLQDSSSNIDVSPFCGWSSSAPGVASSNGSNIITGVSGGTATITCAFNGLSGSSTVTVGSTVIITSPTCATPPCILAQGVNGQVYGPLTAVATGGVLPYTWSVSAGSLPTGITLTNLTNQGVLSGTPTVNGTYNFTLQVVDSGANPPAGVAVRIVVVAPGCVTSPGTGPYCSTLSTAVDPWPSTAPPSCYHGLTGINNTCVETSSTGIGTGSYRVMRATDTSVNAGGSHTNSSPADISWNCRPVCSAGDPFLKGIATGGAFEFLDLDPSAMQVTYKGSVTQAADGTSLLSDSANWSVHSATTIYSAGGIQSSSSYNVQTLNYHTLNYGLGGVWSNANDPLTTTVLLDPTGVTDPCNLPIPSGEANQYLFASAGGVGYDARDVGGPGTSRTDTMYRYQQDNGGLVVGFDGAKPVGQRCFWINFRTGQYSIGGAARQFTTGFTTLPAPAAPTVTVNTVGGNLPCPTNTKPWRVNITYTILNVGESTASLPTVTPTTGSGFTCSLIIKAPSTAVSLGGIAAAHPTGWNAYICNNSPINCINSQRLAIINNSPTSTLARPAITSAVCSNVTGATQFTYYEIARNSLGAFSIPSAAVVTTNTCFGKITGANTVTVSGTTVANANDYWFCRDFLNMCWDNGNSATFIDNGQSPKEFIYQTNLNSVDATIIETTTSTIAPPITNTAGLNIHAAIMTKSGFVRVSSTDSQVANVFPLWDPTQGSLVTFDGGGSQGAQIHGLGAHNETSPSYIFGSAQTATSLQTNRFTMSMNSVAVQASLLQLNLGAAVGSTFDDVHWSYPFPFDNYVTLTSTYIQAGGYGLPTTPGDGEELGTPIATTSASVYRFCRNWTSGANGFNSTARGVFSQDGKWIAFSSNGARNSTGNATLLQNGTIGFGGFSGGVTSNTCTPGGAGTCRTEIMICEAK